VRTKPWKTGRCGAIELLSVLIEKPDRAKQTVTLGFNQPGDDGQHFIERRTRENELQNIQYRLARKQARLTLRLLDSR